MTDHPRRLELERLAMGEASSAQAHVAGCAECAATVTELQQAARAFVARRPTQVFLEELERRRAPWWRRWWPMLGLVPVAAAALLLVLPRGDEVRLKGGGLQIFVTRAERTQVLTADQRPLAGDRLSFSYDAPRAGHLLIIDVERGKPPTAFVPFGADTSLALAAGPATLSGVVLDDTRADEWLLVVFSPRPLTLREVTSSLRDGPPAFDCSGCEVEVRTLTRARP